MSKTELPENMKSIGTRPLFVMRLEVKPLIKIGDAPGGYRRIGSVPGGVFEGDRLSGTVVDGGSDWQIVRTDGSVSLDARLILKTNDGELIGMTYRGLHSGPADIIALLERGEEVEHTNYYFRIQPIFETASIKYDWINRVVAVGTGHRQVTGPVYSVFEVI